MEKNTISKRKKLSELMRFAQERAAAGHKIAEKKAAETPVKLFLIGMDDFMRAMPNHIARSSLFAPVACGRKKLHKDMILVSRNDAVIKFWGEQLDEAQADVWMQAMHEACKKPLGELVTINRAAFLRAIGRHTGNGQYKWLHRAMQALTFSMLVIEVHKKDGKKKLEIGKTRALHMLESFDYDDDTESYTLRIDPRWRNMYKNREFALIDWNKRLQFGRNQNMAKALQRLIATSDEKIQKYTLDWLKKKLEYHSPMRKFREALDTSVRELERLEIIINGQIEINSKGDLQLVLRIFPSV